MERFFPCSSCGAELKYSPGAGSLKCDYCSAVVAVPESDEFIEEHDFAQAVRDATPDRELIDRVEVSCQSCGAHSQLPDNITGAACPFCTTPIVAQSKSVKMLRPQAVLPFALERKQAMDAYERWLSSLWFAPNDLKARALLDQRLKGIYLPYWTYDTEVDTDYTGMRGEDYWVTETYTVNINGRSQMRTRTVRKTRWYPASGRVHNSFDDVLIPATRSLSQDRLIKLEPWDLPALRPFDATFLAGFTTESYSLDLDDGFEVAKERVQGAIEQTIRADIGGDRQIISSKRCHYSDITYKHVLLPVYLSAYTYSGKLFQIIINARTGELSGDRPYSWIKITLAVLAGLAIAGVIALVASLR